MTMDNTKPDILLVDDSFEDAELTLRVLKKDDLIQSGIHLHDGEQALLYLFSTAFEARPKLIVLDIEMPKVNGIEVLRRIKSDPSKMFIPVVMMSSSSNEKHVEESYRLGVNGYVVKHTNYEKFRDEIIWLGKYWLQTNYSPS